MVIDCVVGSSVVGGSVIGGCVVDGLVIGGCVVGWCVFGDCIVTGCVSGGCVVGDSITYAVVGRKWGVARKVRLGMVWGRMCFVVDASIGSAVDKASSISLKIIIVSKK